MVKVFKLQARLQGQKCWNPQKGLVTRNALVKFQSSRTHCWKVINKVKVFKIGQNPGSRSQGKICFYLRKGFVTRNTHVKYQSFSTHCSNIISNKVKVSESPSPKENISQGWFFYFVSKKRLALHWNKLESLVQLW